MKKIVQLIFATLLLSPSASWTQNLNLQMGPEYLEKRTDIPASIFGFDQNGFYMLQHRATARMYGIPMNKEENYLKAFDLDLRPVMERTLELMTDEKKETPEIAILVGGKIQLFSSVDIPKERKMKFMVREVDTKTLTIPAKGKVFSEYSYEGYPRDKEMVLNFEYSRDSSKILFYHQLPNKNGSPERFSVKLFSGEMIPLWEKEFELAYKEGLFSIEDFLVSNDGNVFILGKNFRDVGKAKVDGKPNYDFRILSLNPSTDKPDEFVLDIPDKYLLDTHLGVLPNQQLVCSGVYGDKLGYSVKSGPKGFFHLTIDASTMALRKQSYKDIALSMFEENDLSSRPSRGLGTSPSLFRYDFEDLVVRADGGGVLIGEEQYVVSNTYTTSNGRTYTTYTYYHNDILILNISPDGEIEDAVKIPKVQVQGSSNSLLSYTSGVTDKKIVFLFNDATANLKAAPGTKVARYAPSLSANQNSSVVMVSYDGNQMSKREAITNGLEAGSYFSAFISRQISKDKMLLVFAKGTKRRLAILTI